MAIGPNVKWIKNKFDNLISLIIIFILALIINFIIVYFFKSFTILSNLIIIPIVGQMLHFYLDSQLWKFSIHHNRENVLKYILKFIK